MVSRRASRKAPRKVACKVARKVPRRASRKVSRKAPIDGYTKYATWQRAARNLSLGARAVRRQPPATRSLTSPAHGGFCSHNGSAPQAPQRGDATPQT